MKMAAYDVVHYSTATLADHAEWWTREQGREVPARSTTEWDMMYQDWIAFAFDDLREVIA